MINSIEKMLDKIFVSESNESDLHLLILLSASTSFAALMHVVLLVFSFMLASKPLIFMNVVSLSVYAVCAWFLKNRKIHRVGFVLTYEVLIYTLLSSYYVGSGNYAVFYLVIMLVFQTEVPYSSKRMRNFVTATVWILAMLLVYNSLYYVPIVDLTPIEPLYSLFNLNFGMLGIVLELTIGQHIKSALDNVKNHKIEQFKNQAHTDAMTGMYNRRYADVYLESASSEADIPRCVAMLDIDNFKNINDTYGHAVGDEILKNLSSILYDNLRKTDVIFRWGGEEFLIILENVELSTAGGLLDKTRKKIENTEMQTAAGIISITVTIGAAEFDGTDFWNSVNLCDAKMYQGKRIGKNKVLI